MAKNYISPLEGMKPVREYDSVTFDERGRKSHVHVQVMNHPSEETRKRFNETVYRVQDAIIERINSGQQEPSQAMKKALGWI